MKTLITILCFVALAACNKENIRNKAADRSDFFKNDRDALTKIQHYLNAYEKGEQVSKIVSVSYIDSKDKSYAFVFYTSNLGQGNLVIEREYGEDEDDDTSIGGRSIKCEGEYCNCKVRSIIADNGTVTLDCSCTSCTMLIH